MMTYEEAVALIALARKGSISWPAEDLAKLQIAHRVVSEWRLKNDKVYAGQYHRALQRNRIGFAAIGIKTP